MDEELVMMRLGSQQLQQKRKILKITMRNRWIIDSKGKAEGTGRGVSPNSVPSAPAPR
jgi:hypothetical protein